MRPRSDKHGDQDIMPSYRQILDAPCILHQDEKILLGLCAAMLPPGSTIVEVGTYTGGSARILQAACKGTCTLHSIDIADHVNPRIISKDSFQHFLGDSRAFAQDFQGRIDMAFIDGNHSFQGVLSDYQHLRPLLSPEAVVLFHDVDFDHIGVKVFCDTLVRTGCLRDVVQASRMLSGTHVPDNPMPTAADFAETIRLQGLGYANDEYRQSCRKDEDRLGTSMLAPSFDPLRTGFIGRGSFGWLVSRMFDVPRKAFIDSSQATDPSKTYYVCSYAREAIESTLVHHNGIPPSRMVFVTPCQISLAILDDLKFSGGVKAAKTATSEMEQTLIPSAFLSLPPGALQHLHASGYLHQFFTRFFFKG